MARVKCVLESWDAGIKADRSEHNIPDARRAAVTINMTVKL